MEKGDAMRLRGLLCLLRRRHLPSPCTREVRDATHSRFEIQCRRCGRVIWAKTFDDMNNEVKP